MDINLYCVYIINKNPQIRVWQWVFHKLSNNTPSIWFWVGGGETFSKFVSNKIGSTIFLPFIYSTSRITIVAKKRARKKSSILSPSSLCKLIVQGTLDSKQLTQDSLCKSPKQTLRNFLFHQTSLQ